MTGDDAGAPTASQAAATAGAAVGFRGSYGGSGGRAAQDYAAMNDYGQGEGYWTYSDAGRPVYVTSRTTSVERYNNQTGQWERESPAEYRAAYQQYRSTQATSQDRSQAVREAKGDFSGGAPKAGGYDYFDRPDIFKPEDPAQLNLMRQGYTAGQAAEMLRFDAQQRGDYAAERKYETLRLQAWTTATGESAAYHTAAKESGIPTLPNPYEYGADLFTYAEKGYPQKRSEAFAPMDYTILNLPEGQGGQAFIWKPDAERNYDLRGAMDVVASAQRSGATYQIPPPTSSRYGILDLADQQDIARYVNENPQHQAMGFRTNEAAMSQFTPEVMAKNRGTFVSSVNPTVATSPGGKYYTEQELFTGSTKQTVNRPSDATLSAISMYGGANDANPINAAMITMTSFLTGGTKEVTETGKTQVLDRARLDPSGGAMWKGKYINPETNKPTDVMKFKVGEEYVGDDGKLYQDYEVSDLSKVIVTPQRTTVTQEQSGFERGETNFSQRYTLGGVENYQNINTGSPLDYPENFLRGVVRGVKEKPLTTAINTGVGLGLTALTLGVVNPTYSGLAAKAAAEGSKWAIPAAAAEFGMTKAVPTMMLGAYTYDYGGTLTNNYRGATRESVGRAGERAGYETIPMIVGSLSYSPLKAGITGAGERVTTSYNNMKARGFENVKSDLTWKVESTARNVKSEIKDFAEYGFAKPKPLSEIKGSDTGYIRASVERGSRELPSAGTRARGNPQMAVNRAKTELGMDRLKSTPSGRPTPSQQSRLQMNIDSGSVGGMQRVYGQGDVQWAMPDPVALASQRAAMPQAKAMSAAGRDAGGSGRLESFVKSYDAADKARAAKEPQYYWGQEIGSAKKPKTVLFNGKIIEGYQSKSLVKGKWAMMERFAKQEAWDKARNGLAGIEKTDLYKLGKGNKGVSPLNSGGGGGVRSPVRQGESKGDYTSFSGGGDQRIGSMSRFESPTTLGDQMGLTARGRRLATRQRALEEEFLSNQQQRTPPGMQRPAPQTSVQDVGVVTDQMVGLRQQTGLISAQDIRLLPRTMQVSRAAQEQRQGLFTDPLSRQMTRQEQIREQRQRSGVSQILVPRTGQIQIPRTGQIQITEQVPGIVTVTEPRIRSTLIEEPILRRRVVTEQNRIQRPQQELFGVRERPPGITVTPPLMLPLIGGGSLAGSLKARSGRKHTEVFSTAFGTLTGSLFSGGGFGGEEGAPRRKAVYGNYRGQFTTARGKTIRVKPMPKRMYSL